MSNYYSLVKPNLQLLNTYEFTTMISAVLKHHTPHIKILKKIKYPILRISTWHGTLQVTVMVPICYTSLTDLFCHSSLPSHK